MMHKPLRTLVHTAVLSVLATNTFAAGFSLYGESNASAIGNYGAGLAAEAADASVGWYNPAGLVLIRQQEAVFGGVGVFPNSSITGTSNFVTNLPPPVDYMQTFSGLTTSDSGFVPSFHYALPIGERATFGFSVTSPFGLSTDWAPDSPVRYAATYTEILTVNISPELGVLFTDNFAFGAGLDLQYARVKFNSMIGVPTLTGIVLPYDNPYLLDSLSYNKAKSYAVGFHAGVLGMFNENHTRIGLNYQSQMNHTFYGYSRLTGPLATPSNIGNPASFADGLFLNNNLFSNSVSLPDIVTLSAYQDINPRLALLGSLIFNHWSVFKAIALNNVAAATIDGGGNIVPINVNAAIPQNYEDAWRVAVGANYYVMDNLMMRVGGGYDQTPTNPAFRDVRLPDSSRWALAIGGRYFYSQNLSFDLGYQHLFGINNTGVNSVEPIGDTTNYFVNASASNYADLVGLQVNWIIDQIPVAPTK